MSCYIPVHTDPYILLYQVKSFTRDSIGTEAQNNGTATKQCSEIQRNLTRIY